MSGGQERVLTPYLMPKRVLTPYLAPYLAKGASKRGHVKGTNMGTLSLRVLSDAEIERMHQETLEVLAKVGAKITHEEALQRLARAGAHVESVSGIVRFPRELVGELLALAPSEAIYTGLNGKLLRLGGDRRYYLSLILDPVIADYEKGLRHPVLEDVRRHTILGESLDRVDAMMRMQYPVSDVPEPECYERTMEVFLCHTTKHVSAYPTSVANCRQWMDVTAVIADAAGLPVDTTPLLSVAMAVTSPLQIHGPNIEIMKMAMERCYPVISTVCPMAGTTAPYSLAGTVLAANVEALLPVLIAQVFKPGHPVLYAVGPPCPRRFVRPLGGSSAASPATLRRRTRRSNGAILLPPNRRDRP